MSECCKKYKNEIIIFFVLFALIFVRYCYYGFEYFYQLDDYIQYHNYLIKYGGALGAIKTLGLLAARPLAGCADVIVWTHFFPVMISAVAIISAMFSLSALLLYKVWSKHFGTGYLFLIIYTVLPVAFEGTYWVSASTRIVTGMFFASLCLYFFDKWCFEKKYRHLLLYIFFQLTAYGFYEQVIVFSITSVILAGILNLKESGKRAWCGLFSLVNAAVYFIFTSVFSESALYGEKGSLMLPGSPDYWNIFIPNITGQIKSVFVDGTFYTLLRGVRRGVEILVSDFNFLYVIAVIALCLLLFFAAKNREQKRTKAVSAIVVSILLIIAPVTPFFVLSDTWFSLRGIVPSLCGLALFADTLVGLIFSGFNTGKIFVPAFTVLLALVCCVSSISELHDYRETTLCDVKIADTIAQRLDSDGLTGSDVHVGVLNLEATYLEEQNFYYHEHIHGVTEKWWSLAGLIECRHGQGYPRVTPVASSPMYKEWNRENIKFTNFDVMYLYKEGELERLSLRKNDFGGYDLYGEKGESLGYTWEEGMTGYLELN